MAIYQIEWKSSAIKDLKKLDRAVIPRIIDSIQTLSTNPAPIGSRKLHGADRSYRIRIGDYRVIYEIHNDILTVLIIRVRHRKDVYRD